MKLYSSPNSPYARLPRIVIAEKKLEARVEILPAITRVANSPYYGINPSGRVPFLITDDGLALEESLGICEYLDQLTRPSALRLAESWPERALEARAQSLLAGLAVLVREDYRPEGERSPTFKAHEMARSQRMFDFWEEAVEDPWIKDIGIPFNFAQLHLIAALDLERRNPSVSWRSSRPRLGRWHQSFSERPSIIDTRPVAG